MIKKKNLAAVEVVVERAALKSRKESVCERSTECGKSLAQHMSRVLGLCMYGYATRSDLY